MIVINSPLNIPVQPLCEPKGANSLRQRVNALSTVQPERLLTTLVMVAKK
jgi:hypothetical protein